MKSDLIDIACEIVADTPKAVLIVDGSEERSPHGPKRLRQVWLPKSQVEIDTTDGKTTVTMPEWLAIKSGLV